MSTETKTPTVTPTVTVGLEVKMSKIAGAGYGVFATRDYAAGELVCFYDGEETIQVKEEDDETGKAAKEFIVVKDKVPIVRGSGKRKVHTTGTLVRVGYPYSPTSPLKHAAGVGQLVNDYASIAMSYEPMPVESTSSTVAETILLPANDDKKSEKKQLPRLEFERMKKQIQIYDRISKMKSNLSFFKPPPEFTTAAAAVTPTTTDSKSETIAVETKTTPDIATNGDAATNDISEVVVAPSEPIVPNVEAIQIVRVAKDKATKAAKEKARKKRKAIAAAESIALTASSTVQSEKKTTSASASANKKKKKKSKSASADTSAAVIDEEVVNSSSGNSGGSGSDRSESDDWKKKLKAWEMDGPYNENNVGRLWATKSIKCGEELFLYYGSGYWISKLLKASTTPQSKFFYYYFFDGVPAAFQRTLNSDESSLSFIKHFLKIPIDSPIWVQLGCQNLMPRSKLLCFASSIIGK